MSEIRQAKPSDAVELAQLAEETFRDTFAEFNAADDMNRFCQLNFGLGLQSRELSDEKFHTLLALENNNIIAYSQMRRKSYPICVNGSHPAEILRFYVDKKWHGKGLAFELMTASLQVLKQLGKDAAWLGVWEHNPRAIKFYEKFDFFEVGENIFPLGAQLQKDLIMQKTIV